MNNPGVAGLVLLSGDLLFGALLKGLLGTIFSFCLFFPFAKPVPSLDPQP